MFREVAFELDIFKEHLATIQNALVNEGKRIEQKYLKWTGVRSEENRVTHETIVKQYQELFPEMQRENNLIDLMRMVERNVNRICDHVQKHLKLKTSLTVNRGSGVKKGLKYLEETGVINLTKPLLGYATVEQARKIRNALMHGESKTSDKELIRYLKVTEGLDFEEEGGNIVINDKYLELALFEAKQFFDALKWSIGPKLP